MEKNLKKEEYISCFDSFSKNQKSKQNYFKGT
jgi:hypothetical protein